MNEFKLRPLYNQEKRDLSSVIDNVDSARIWTSDLVNVLLDEISNDVYGGSEYVIEIMVFDDDHVSAYSKFLDISDPKLAERECTKNCKHLSKLADEGDTQRIHKYLVSKNFINLGWL